MLLKLQVSINQWVMKSVPAFLFVKSNEILDIRIHCLAPALSHDNFVSDSNTDLHRLCHNVLLTVDQSEKF